MQQQTSVLRVASARDTGLHQVLKKGTDIVGLSSPGDGFFVLFYNLK